MLELKLELTHGLTQKQREEVLRVLRASSCGERNLYLSTGEETHSFREALNGEQSTVHIGLKGERHILIRIEPDSDTKTSAKLEGKLSFNPEIIEPKIYE